jgi:multidrug resistance efflux pump
VDIVREPTRKGKKYVVSGAVVAALLVVTIGLSRLQPAAPSVDAATIWTDTVERGTLLIQVSGAGTLVPERVRWVPAEIPGRVERKLVQPGTAVTPNTVLLELSNPDVRLELLEAERELSTARQQLVGLQTTLQTMQIDQLGLLAQIRARCLQAERNREVLEELARRGDGFVSEVELATARESADELHTRLDLETRRLAIVRESEEPQLQVQRDQIERLTEIVAFQRRRIASMQVRAGIDGVLQEMNLEEGQWVLNGQVLARVVVPERLKAELRVPQLQARDVALGQIALVDLRSDSVTGRVVRIDPAAQDGFVAVDVELPDELPRSARPGLRVEGIVEIERLDGVLFVSRPAFGQAHSTVGLFRLVDGGKAAERVTVRLGRASVTVIQVVDGLQPGEVVILRDMSQWDEYDRVRIKG